MATYNGSNMVTLNPKCHVTYDKAIGIKQANFSVLGYLQQSFKFTSIFISKLHYLTTLYLFFQINTPAVLFILLSILLKYTFLLLFPTKNNQLPPNKFLIATKQTD